MSMRLDDLPPNVRARILQQTPTPTPPGKDGPRESNPMNKGEKRYSEHLDRLKAAGQITEWRFEAIRLRLAERWHYTPDFFVRLPDGREEYHEVKGRKGNSYYAHEDAVKSVKGAAANYPFWRFIIVWPGEGGGWKQREFRP